MSAILIQIHWWFWMGLLIDEWHTQVTALKTGSTNNSDAMAAQVHEAFTEAQLGYAYMSLATFNDLDHGPNIQFGKINPRVPNPKAIKKLYESTHDGQNVMNNVPEHAIYICLPKNYIKPESLSPSSSGAKFVAWAPQALKGDANEALLANGLHRWWMVMSYLCKTEILAWKRVKEVYTHAVGKGGKGKESKEKAEKALVEMGPPLRELSKWLVLFFDHGMDTHFLEISFLTFAHQIASLKLL
jgi:hypothetical protein